MVYVNNALNAGVLLAKTIQLVLRHLLAARIVNYHYVNIILNHQLMACLLQNFNIIIT